MRRPSKIRLSILCFCLLTACGTGGEGDDPPPPEAASPASDPVPRSEAIPAVETPTLSAPSSGRAYVVLEAEAEPGDTLPVTIVFEAPGCAPGRCTCRGSAAQATGLWRAGAEPRPDAPGDDCLVADLDGSGVLDYVLLGAEGMLGVVLYGSEGPARTFSLDAGGPPELYVPRAEAGPNGEPPSRWHGIFVPNVGRSHAVFVWSGETFERILYPAP